MLLFYCSRAWITALLVHLAISTWLWSGLGRHLNSPWSCRLLWQHIRFSWLQAAIKHVLWRMRHIRDAQVENRAQLHFVSPREARRVCHRYFSRLLQLSLIQLSLEPLSKNSSRHIDCKSLQWHQSTYCLHSLLLIFSSALQKRDCITPLVASLLRPPIRAVESMCTHTCTNTLSFYQSHSPSVFCLSHFLLFLLLSHQLFLQSHFSLTQGHKFGFRSVICVIN